MIKKLLNRKNLIIIFIVTVLCLFFMPNYVHAVPTTVTEGDGSTSTTATTTETETEEEATTNSSSSSDDDVETLSGMIGDSVAAWFQIIKTICLIVMIITFFIIILYGFVQNTGQAKFTARKMMTQWIIGFFLLVFIDTIIYAVLLANENTIDVCQTIARNLAGEEGSTEETSLYESAISKAYEIKMSSRIFRNGIIYSTCLLFS